MALPEPRGALHMTGYSGTALVKKLGVKEGFKIYTHEAPADYKSLLAPLPAAVQFVRMAGGSTDLAHVFTVQRSILLGLLKLLRKELSDEASVWVSWPKKASKVPTDITEDVVREVALPLGFVDIKVCAVTEVWSALKLVVRKELRK
jgi:hypothetical protein